MSVCDNNQYKGVNSAIMRWGLSQPPISPLISKNCKQVCYFNGFISWCFIPVFINNQYQGINVAMITLRLVAVSSFHFWITNKYVILVINDQKFWSRKFDDSNPPRITRLCFKFQVETKVIKWIIIKQNAIIRRN